MGGVDPNRSFLLMTGETARSVGPQIFRFDQVERKQHADHALERAAHVCMSMVHPLERTRPTAGGTHERARDSHSNGGVCARTGGWRENWVRSGRQPNTPPSLVVAQAGLARETSVAGGTAACTASAHDGCYQTISNNPTQNRRPIRDIRRPQPKRSRT